jgi:hypothetical protein
VLTWDDEKRLAWAKQEAVRARVEEEATKRHKEAKALEREIASLQERLALLRSD